MNLDGKMREAYEHGRLAGENELLKTILEQLLKIKLIPRLGDFA